MFLHVLCLGSDYTTVNEAQKVYTFFPRGHCTAWCRPQFDCPEHSEVNGCHASCQFEPLQLSWTPNVTGTITKRLLKEPKTP